MYARSVSGRTLSFGVSGMLWRENLVMYDRETDSWWAQATGQAIEGPLKGTTLQMRPSDMMTWKEWRARHPRTLVLSKIESGRTRGTSDVYTRYHDGGNLGVTGRTRLNTGGVGAKTRVLGFRFNGKAFAVVLDDLASEPVLVSAVPGEPFVIAGTPDGSGARAFRAGPHAFSVRQGAVLVDEATGSEWSAFEGLAIEGDLAGTRLEPVPATLAYWFAWRAFFPDAAVLRRTRAPSRRDRAERPTSDSCADPHPTLTAGGIHRDPACCASWGPSSCPPWCNVRERRGAARGDR